MPIVAAILGIVGGSTRPFWWCEVLSAFGHVCDKPIDNVGWLSKSDFNAKFEAEKSKGLYPYTIEGKVADGEERFRGKWAPSGSACFDARSILTVDEFIQKQQTLLAKGYSLVWVSSFERSPGKFIFQATWTQSPCRSEQAADVAVL
ncbi:hypothetical protein [Luteibacter sp.]|uniref:hypothetical protein n=1 Tax=Luteibacter sp. TaxID=1886636 RepID=UPI002F415E3A